MAINSDKQTLKIYVSSTNSSNNTVDMLPPIEQIDYYHMNFGAFREVSTNSPYAIRFLKKYSIVTGRKYEVYLDGVNCDELEEGIGAVFDKFLEAYDIMDEIIEGMRGDEETK